MQLNMGPAPKPADQRARRNKPSTANMVLPSEGRKKPTPPWPGNDLPSQSEWQLWEHYWRKPQAVAWEALDADVYDVKRLVQLRCLDLSDDTKKTGKYYSGPNNPDTEIRQLSDRLGLNPMAMRRLGWEVKAPDIEPERATASPRDRYSGLRAVTAEDSNK